MTHETKRLTEEELGDVVLRANVSGDYEVLCLVAEVRHLRTLSSVPTPEDVARWARAVEAGLSDAGLDAKGNPMDGLARLQHWASRAKVLKAELERLGRAGEALHAEADGLEQRATAAESERDAARQEVASLTERLEHTDSERAAHDAAATAAEKDRADLRKQVADLEQRISRETAWKESARLERDAFKAQAKELESHLSKADTSAAVAANRAEVALSRAEAAERKVAELVALAERHGWNGVDNSKHLSVFLEDALADARRFREACERAKDGDGLAAALRLRGPTEDGVRDLANWVLHGDATGPGGGEKEETCGMARYVQHDVGPDHRITEPCSYSPGHGGRHSWEPAPTTPTAPAGLLEAVGPRITPVERLVDVARRLASGANTRHVWDDLDAALAAYDAAKAAPSVQPDDAHADLRRVLEMARTGSHVGDTATTLGEEAVQAVRALRESSVPLATLAAVVEDGEGLGFAMWVAAGNSVEAWPKSHERWKDTYRTNALAVAREVLRRVSSGQVPRVLTEARVAEVLRKWLPPTHAAFNDLGLSLDAPKEETKRDPRQPDDGPPLSASDLDLIDAAWERHKAIVSKAETVTPVPGFPMPPESVRATIRARRPTPPPTTPPLKSTVAMWPKDQQDAQPAPAVVDTLDGGEEHVCGASLDDLCGFCHLPGESSPTVEGLPESSTVEANLKPDSNSPVVAWEGDGVRVLEDGTLLDGGREDGDVIVILARALAEAKQETKGTK